MLQAVILGGGKSSRMGTEKALLRYYQQPQIFHLAALLAPFCEGVALACRQAQMSAFQEAGWRASFILDNPEWGEIGPINVVLSALTTTQGACLVLGCDYPFLTSLTLTQLISNRNPHCIATAFKHPASGIIEPLIAIYEAAALPLLADWVKNDRQSLRQFLETNPVHILEPIQPKALTSVDTYPEFMEARIIPK